ASARDMLVTQESGCYWAEAAVLAQSNALPCRNPLGKSSDKSPWHGRLRRDWAEEEARFPLPAAPLHGGRPLVEERLCGSREHPHMTEAPTQGRISSPTVPLL